MRVRPRALPLAGAAALAVSGAVAQVTVNGSPATVADVSQIVWNGRNISQANPLPVAVTTGGTGAYAVGQFNPVLPTFAAGQAGPLSVDAAGRVILAPSSSVGVSNFPASQKVFGTVTADLGTLNGAATAAAQTAVQSAPGTSAATAVTVQGAASGVELPVSAASLPLPGGAATGANQATEIAALQAIQQRAVTYLDAVGATITGGGTFYGTVRDAGAAPAYSRITVLGYTNVRAITLTIRACLDSACATAMPQAELPIAANGTASATGVLTTRYWQIKAVNGTSDPTAVIFASSMTAN